MTVYLLPEEPFFPSLEEAEPDGLVAIGGDLSTERLLQAYASGIFPWFMEEGEIFWYSPDPRLVLFPDRFRLSGSLARIIRSNRFTIRFDSAFSEVILNCSEAPRPSQEGTWISHEFIEAYTRLHKMGFAHSVEVYAGHKLAGGLYGISLGAAFFGESMFSKVNNASKAAFHALAERCSEFGFGFIDCQVDSEHLRKMGASLVTRQDYLLMLKESMKSVTIKGPWR
jgi:leucyl/phenylalanyl-tRNA--protein transferase